MNVTLTKAAALLCAGSLCQPALYGVATPVGTYVLQRAYSTRLHQDVIVFHRIGNDLLAIHRVWRGAPQQHRDQRLASPDPSDNVISSGCVNVGEAMFQKLWALPDGTAFTISP